MHIFADLVYLESVRMQDEERLLVTSLTNRLMPFIRYDLGDSGRLLEGECPCGSPFPMMEMGMCRQNDLIRVRGGKTFDPAYFNRLLDGRRQVRQYQWVQRDLDHIELRLVADQKLDAEALSSIRTRIREEVDADMSLDVHYVEEVPRTAAGKHRFVIGMQQGR